MAVCAQCGFDLRGATSARCSDCGQQFDWNDSYAVRSALRARRLSVLMMVVNTFFLPFALRIGFDVINELCRWFGSGRVSIMRDGSWVALLPLIPAVCSAGIFSCASGTLHRFRAHGRVTPPVGWRETLRDVGIATTLVAIQVVVALWLYTTIERVLLELRLPIRTF